MGDRFAHLVVISRDSTTISYGAEVGNYVQLYRHDGAKWKTEISLEKLSLERAQ